MSGMMLSLLLKTFFFLQSICRLSEKMRFNRTLKVLDSFMNLQQNAALKVLCKCSRALEKSVRMLRVCFRNDYRLQDM